jgi:hypothetical protein
MNNISLALKVFEFEFGLNYIQEVTGIIPTATYSKGTTYFVGPEHNRISKQYEDNYWEYRVHIHNNSAWIQKVIDQFVKEVLLERKESWMQINELCKKELYIGVRYYQELDNFHFNNEFLALCEALKVEIDIDQYLSSEREGGNNY